MDATPGPTHMGALAGVLLEMGALHPDHRAIGQGERTVDIQRLVILRDLIRLRHVGIEVVLPGEHTRTDLAPERQPDPHRQLDRATVQHRQRPRQTKRHRIDVRVRLITEPVRRRREQLGGGRQLDMHLEADHHLETLMRPGHDALRSNSAATWNITGSPRAGANTCTPTGRSSAPEPNGTLIAGCPARFDGIV